MEPRVDYAFFIATLGGAFAIMNPFVVLPLFLAVTHGMSPAQQRHAGLRVAFFSAVLCAVVAISGAAILKFFGISVDDFRVAWRSGADDHRDGHAQRLGQPRA